MKRIAVILLLLVLAVSAAAVLGAGPLLDSAAGHARLAAALDRATGHATRLDGPVRLRWSLVPTLEAQDVAVLNGPGYSRPALATARRVAARVALLPLLAGRTEVRDVVLDGPDVLLERDAAGRGNWLPPDRPASPNEPAGASRPARPVSVQHLVLTDGRIAWRGAPPLIVERLELTQPGGALSGTVQLNGATFQLGGTTAADGRVELTAVSPALVVAASGTVGGAMAVQARAPDLSAVSALAGRALPPLRDVALSIALPGPGAVRMTAGPSALDGVAPGLTLGQLLVEAASMDEPLHLSAVLAWRDLPVALAVNAASLRSVLAGGEIPLQARLAADGAVLDAQGTVDAGGTGASMTVSARVPDLRRTGALAGQRWPGLRDLSLDARVLPRPGGAGLLLRGLRLTAAQGDLAGDLALGTLPVPSLRGSLVSQRLDLDGVFEPAPAPAAPVPAPRGPAPAASAAPAAPPADAARAFAALRSAAADLHWVVAQATWRGAAYRAIEARLFLQDGRLRLDPMQFMAPGGPVQAQLLVDAAAVPPTLAVQLRAPALDLAPVFAAAAGPGAPRAATGTAELDVQLRAAGADTAALLATLDGRFAAAMVDGEIENAALLDLFGPALRAANLPLEAAGRSRLRCLALRGDAAAGRLTLGTLALDTTRVKLEGEGGVNLVDRTMDLHLRPSIRIGPTFVAVPVRLTGPLRQPVPAIERGVVAPGRFGIAIGGPAPPDPCPAALAAVHAR